MSYFDDASLVMIPSGYKTDKVYSVKPTDGSGDLTFTRSNDTATRVNSAGVIEKVRTNLVKSSGDISTQSTYWTSNQSGSTTQNAAVAPDGTTTAAQITSAGSSYSGVSQASISVAAVPHTYSCYLKATSGTPTIRLTFYDGVTFHQGNFTITSEWVRYSFTFTPLAGSFAVYNTCSSVATWLAWGAQLETGDIATDYIATTSAAVSVGPVANVPRLDYLGSSCPRLLLEPQRTNALVFSEQMDNANWIKNVNAAVTANQAISPDGYQNADLVSNTLVGGGMDYYQLVTGSASTTYTYSVFVKAATHTKCALRAFVGGTSPFTTTPAAYFDLATASVIQSYGSATNAKIEAVGSNGWYRVSMTFPTIGTAHYLNLFPLSDTYNTSASNAPINYSSTGGVYFWGAQYEIGSYATSYIPTLGAAVTRGADATYKGSISSLIGATEGVLFVDFIKPPTGTPRTKIARVSALLTDGGNSFVNSINLDVETNGNLRGNIVTGGTSQVDIQTAAYAAGTRIKMALAYKANDCVLYINGTQIGTDTSATIPVCTAYEIGSYETVSTTQTNYVSQALLFKTRLTNAQLAELTTL